MPLSLLQIALQMPTNVPPSNYAVQPHPLKAVKKVWSKSSYYSKHVSKAKQVGINCGVVEIVASCDNDPELCSVDELCKQSVQKSGGKTVWKSSSKAAKVQGLGVTAIAAKMWCSRGTVYNALENP